MRLIDQFLATTDPVYDGFTGAFLALGYGLTDGMVFPFVGGGTALLRRRLYPDVGAWRVCGFARPSDSQVTTLPGFTHEASMGFQYAAANLLGNGYASPISRPVRIDFDGGSNLISPGLPMFPTYVSAIPISGGRVIVSWEYDGYGSDVYPSDFQVFEGATPGGINYAAPLVDEITMLDHVVFSGNRHRFRLITPAFPDGSDHVFAVRARSAAGTAEQNPRTTESVIARAIAGSLTGIDLVIERSL